MKPYDIYYHVTPEAGITKFQGRYSQKYKTRGLFVCPKFSSIACSWAPYVSSKKHPRSAKLYLKDKDFYQNLTVYKLKIPKSIAKICLEYNNQKYKEACAKVKDKTKLFGTWGWDLELFISQEFLESIQIIGKQKFLRNEIHKYDRIEFEKHKDPTHLGYAKRALPNCAAKKYIELSNMINQYVLNLSSAKRELFRHNVLCLSEEINRLFQFFIKEESGSWRFYPTPSRVFSKLELNKIDSIFESSLIHFNKLKLYVSEQSKCQNQI